MDSDGSVTGQTRTSDGSDGCDGLFKNFLRKTGNKNNFIFQDVVADKSEIGHDPSLVAKSITIDESPAADPSPSSITTRHQPITTRHNPSLALLVLVKVAGFVASTYQSKLSGQSEQTQSTSLTADGAAQKKSMSLGENMTPVRCTLHRPDGTTYELPAQYPGTRAYNQTKEPKKIAARLKAITCKADWEAIKNQYGTLQATWVWRWHFKEADRNVLAEIMSGKFEQGKLDLNT
jgi:hypothetical protein